MLVACSVLPVALAKEGDAVTDPNAPAAAAAPQPILRVAEPIVIDGDLAKPCWANAAPIRADYVNSKQGVLSDQPRMAARYAYDDDYLYIGYETFDKNLIAIGSGKKEGPADNQREGCEIFLKDVKVDVVEFFISFGDEHFFWEIHHNALNQFNDVFCVTLDPNWPIAKAAMYPHGIIFCPEQFLPDDGPHKLSLAVKLKPKADGKPSTVNDANDEDTGYMGEIRIPWYALGAPAAARTFVMQPSADPNSPPKRVSGPWNMTGRQLSILAVVQDGDLAERYHHSSPTRSGGWFHTTMPLWPKYVLTDSAAKTK